MAGGNHPKSTVNKPPPAASGGSHRKSRWESSSTAGATSQPQESKPGEPKHPKPLPNSKPSPRPKVAPGPNDPVPPPAVPPFPFPDLGPPPAPAYGFHMLERRTFVLADGSVRSYFALPPDYQDFPPRPLLPPMHLSELPVGGGVPHFPQMSPEGLGFRDMNHNLSLKRKYEEEFKYRNNPNDAYPMGPSDYRGEFSAATSSPFWRDISDELRHGKHMRVSGDGMFTRHIEVEQNQIKKAFLYFAKVINENEAERKRYLEDGKQGRLRCLVCNRSSKDFPNMHALILHTYNSDSADSRVDHLGLHKALCVLMGWNYSKPPDNSKAYQFLPADEAAANQDDLIIWPPMVIIHNTVTGKGKDGRIEGLGNRAMDNKMRDLGFAGGKSKSLYGRDGHLGITLVKYGDEQAGLREAVRLAEYFEKENHGRRAWDRIQTVTQGKDDDRNPSLVKVDRNGEKERIFYGYLGTAADLCKVDFETRKKVRIESKRDHPASK
ncbi:hypothetical protein K2173_008756 [Erythroxylum novogranatense]|uniref:XS domain-containing protein n=1 Tax=Erythroxylum novogranatense TaxID=1862640 RepID=A0AAV8S5K5_9ROSI|nr:hypothetical protein K2173_008756 [Erythroxylum novogranatense]